MLCYSLIPAPIVYIHTTGMAHFRILERKTKVGKMTW